MTQTETAKRVKDESMMATENQSDFSKKLSPSASAVMRFIRLFETGEKVNVFQEDADFQNLSHIVGVYKGHLHTDLNKRLRETFQLGGVEIITQRDVMSLIAQLWSDNVSSLTKTEIPFLSAVLKNPEAPLKELSHKAGQSYAQSRRAQKRLLDTGVLKIGGILNADLLGLERVLIVQENPSLVLSGVYTQKQLFVDGYAPIVITIGIIPHSNRDEFLDMIRSLRNTTTNVSVYSLSTGSLSFNGLYLHPQQGWSVDLLHFRLLLRRGGDPVVLSDVPTPTVSTNTHFKYSDALVIDALVESLDGSASSIASSTGLSLSSVFRKRANILQNRIIQPRGRVNIPQLSDRIAVICSPEVGGSIKEGWQNLPLTYTSQIQNLEQKSERKMLLLSALPTGSAQGLLDVLADETSRADTFSAHAIAAGIGSRTKVSSILDGKDCTWRFDVSQHFDARPYSVARKEASGYNIPLDLAE